MVRDGDTRNCAAPRGETPGQSVVAKVLAETEEFYVWG